MVVDSWLEISLTVDGELAEAVADVLARYVEGGVVIESTQIAPDPKGEGFPIGPLRVCGYLPMDEKMKDTRRQIEESLWYLGRIRPLPKPHFEILQQTDWTEAWKGHYRPIAVGQRLMIVPAWLEAHESDRISILIDPGMAFGTGTHPTTQLCLEILETYLPDRIEQKGKASVIDLGCGSGIISIAAARLGADWVLGVDVDLQAVSAAQKNAELNGFTRNLEFGLGSQAEIQAGIFSLQQAELVLVNILAPVIIRLLGEGLKDLLIPGGLLVLSGILEEQVQEVEQALRKQGLSTLERRVSEDWVALVCGA